MRLTNFRATATDEDGWEVTIEGYHTALLVTEFERDYEVRYEPVLTRAELNLRILSMDPFRPLTIKLGDPPS